MEFKLHAPYKPMGDQPEAIDTLCRGLEMGIDEQVLLGVTGSGKTFTMANVIARMGRPTLVLAHNKTLAAQLCAEFKEFFPENAVEYFVSYYDYYQPEAYIPHTDTYIEKDSSVNDEIDRLRLSATASLLERRDVIVVSSVSCIYGLGEPDDFEAMMVPIRVGMEIRIPDLLKKFADIRYERNDLAFERNMFRVRGDTVEVWPAYWKDTALRIEFFGDEVDRISEVNTVTGAVVRRLTNIPIWPATHYVTPREKMDRAIQEILRECDQRVAWFKEHDKLIEAQRIYQRTMYDVEMLQELGYCSGIENYSRIISGRPVGSAPMTLLDYFPKDFILFVDESHVTLPQVRAMYRGDRARKEALVEYGFRLPSAFDNRPLKFDEFNQRIHQAIYVSATPAEYERERAGQSGGPPRGGADRRPHRGDQRPDGEKGACAGHHPHQAYGGGPDGVSPEGGHQGPLYAPRHRRHRAHGDHPGPEAGDLRRLSGHQPPPGGAGPARGEFSGHLRRGQGGLFEVRDKPHPDHRPRRPERPGPGYPLRRHGDPLHEGGHGRDGPPPEEAGRLQPRQRHRA